MSETSRRHHLGRFVGIAVAAVLLWLVAQNVPWGDALLVGPEGGDPAADVESYAGEIVGPWKGDTVRFRFLADQDLAPGSPLAGTPAGTAVELGGEVTATVGGLDSRTWRIAGGSPTEGGPAVRTAASVEWRPGVPRAFSDLDVRGALPAALFLFLASLFCVTRWWRLLALTGCPTRWWTAFRLTYVGLFFNVVLPGSTGGDLARAVIVVRDNPKKRADALMSVMADRLLGLLAMFLLATVSILTNDDRLAEFKVPIVLGLTAFVVGLAVFLNPWLRRAIRYDSWLPRLPQGERLQKLDEAFRSYARHPGEVSLAVALSLGNHVCNVVAAYFIGHAFGDVLTFHDYLCVVTIANTISAIPASPGGLGVGEVLFGSLFSLLGASYLLGVATSLTYRFGLYAMGLGGGGIVLLLPGGRQVREQFEEQRDAPTEAPPDPTP